MYKRNVLLDRLALVVLEAAGVLGAALTAVWLRHVVGIGGGPTPGVPWAEYLRVSILAVALYVALLAMNGLYRSPLPGDRLWIRLSKVAVYATSILLVLSFFYRGFVFSRVSVVLFLGLSVPTLVGTRTLHRAISKRMRTWRESGRRLAIIGSGPPAKKLGQSLLDDPAYYTLVGFIHDSSGAIAESEDGYRILGATSDLPELVTEHSIDEIILATPESPRQRQQQLVGECMAMGVRWRLVPDIAGLVYDRVVVDLVGGLPTVGARGTRVVGYNWVLKRAFDLVVASLTLIVLSPLMLVVAAVIKATSAGPVLYRQERVGHEGKTFTLLKFRTMTSDAQAEVHERYTSDWILGKSGDPGVAVHKLTADERVTRVGKFLRATSIDELPQLWNVVRGEMSIVGPRPPLPYEVDKYTEAHKRRFEALPGITGLWQVSGRNRLTFEEMIRLDVSYIENWSLNEDLRILMRTIPAVLSGRGH